MFVQSEEFIRQHGGRIGDISIYGQESNHTTWKLAKMNLAIRGIEANLGPHHADTFHNDLHKDLKADFVLANPPFNMSDWGGERLRDDVRWKYGAPPVGNANFASTGIFLQEENHRNYRARPHVAEFARIDCNTRTRIPVETDLLSRWGRAYFPVAEAGNASARRSGRGPIFLWKDSGVHRISHSGNGGSLLGGVKNKCPSMGGDSDRALRPEDLHLGEPANQFPPEEPVCRVFGGAELISKPAQPE